MTDLPVLGDAVLTLDQGVALLRLDRHDVRNALTGTALASDIVAVCRWANACREVGALVLTGNGSAFSAGGNVHDMHERKDMFGHPPMEMQQDYRAGIQQMTLAMQALEVPAIAAINGAAIGAGLDLACMCDIRLASEAAVMGETFVNLGLLPGDGGAWFLPRVVGMQHAAELTFSGRTFDAREALAMGLVLEVVPPGELVARGEAMARDFAARPRDASRIAKRLLRAGERMELGDFLDLCAALQSLCHTTAAHEEAMAGMLARMRG